MDTAVVFIRRMMAANPAVTDDPDVDDGALAALLDAKILEASPAWQRLGILVHQRGLEGWTNIRDAGTRDTR